MARGFKFTTEDFVGPLDVLVSILEPEAEVQVHDPFQLEEHTAAHPKCARVQADRLTQSIQHTQAGALSAHESSLQFTV